MFNDIYAAGLLDGEGCFGIVKAHSREHSARVTVAMTTEPVLRWLQNTYGGAVSRRPVKEGWKPVWAWVVQGPRSVEVARRVRPFLKVKQMPAWLLEEFSAATKGKQGIRVTDELFALREGFKLAMHEANK